MQLLKLMDGLPNINFYYIFTFFYLFFVFMIVGLVGEAVVIAKDFRPLIPPLFLSPNNSQNRTFSKKIISSRT